MFDAAKLLQRNFMRLAEAGCKHIQVDEPYLTPPSDEEVRSAVEAINLSIEGLPEDVHIAVHVCQGN
jgi:5-methyltetrahydropteroyltriglutamate--homocysteine methyltransferase